MVPIKNSLCENIKNHWGNMIFYSYLGHPYTHSRPGKVRNPGIPLQQQQHNQMRDITIFYKIARQNPLACIWQRAANVQGMKGLNLFVKLNIAVFSGNGRRTDHDKLHFSYGLLPQSNCFRVVSQASDTLADIFWKNTSLLSKEHYMDLFMAVVLFENDELIAFTNFGSVYPREGLLSPALSTGRQFPAVSGLLFFVSANGNNYSSDVCCQSQE